MVDPGVEAAVPSAKALLKGELPVCKILQGTRYFVEAYSPFGTGTVFASPGMKVLLGKYGKSIGQIALRWCFQNDFVSLPILKGIPVKHPNRMRYCLKGMGCVAMVNCHPLVFYGELAVK